jgi:hypothetical protein
MYEEKVTALSFLAKRKDVGICVGNECIQEVILVFPV